jgi:hypothetical protein
MGKIQSSSKYGLDYNAIIENLTPFPQNTAEYDIDHLIPLSLYDLEDKKEVKKSFNPQNLRWLMKRENIQKSNNLRKQDLELIAQIPKKLYPKSGIVQIALRS